MQALARTYTPRCARVKRALVSGERRRPSRRQGQRRTAVVLLFCLLRRRSRRRTGPKRKWKMRRNYITSSSLATAVYKYDKKKLSSHGLLYLFLLENHHMGLDRPLFPQESRIGSRITTNFKSFETPSWAKLNTTIMYHAQNIVRKKNLLDFSEANFRLKRLEFCSIGGLK